MKKLERIFNTLVICSTLALVNGFRLDRDAFIEQKPVIVGRRMKYGGGAGILLNMGSGMYVRSRNDKKEEESDTDYKK